MNLAIHHEHKRAYAQRTKLIEPPVVENCAHQLASSARPLEGDLATGIGRRDDRRNLGRGAAKEIGVVCTLDWVDSGDSTDGTGA